MADEVEFDDANDDEPVQIGRPVTKPLPRAAPRRASPSPAIQVVEVKPRAQVRAGREAPSDLLARSRQMISTR